MTAAVTRAAGSATRESRASGQILVGAAPVIGDHSTLLLTKVAGARMPRRRRIWVTPRQLCGYSALRDGNEARNFMISTVIRLSVA